MNRGKNPVKSRGLNKSNKILPDIIREHALRYLPAKSLHRFTAVCRDWKLQISTPFFVHSQSYSFHSFSGLFRQSPGSLPSFISLDPAAYGVPDPELKFLPEPVDVQTSCNGLLCCRGRTGDRSYYISNPVNRHWKKLPKPNADHGFDPSLVLIFEPSLLDFVADYKLVCAYRSADFDDAYEFEIYSSSEDLWQNSSEICFGDKGRVLQKGGVHLNGVVYWASNLYSLVAFDVKKDRLTVIPCYDLRGSFALGVMDGKLCASHKGFMELTVFMLSNVYANTMQMEATYKTWEVKQQILPMQFEISATENHHQVRVLAFRSEAIVLYNGRRIFIYDLKTKETKISAPEAEHNENCVYVPYVNSLVSL